MNYPKNKGQRIRDLFQTTHIETQASKLNSQRHHRPNIKFQVKIVNLHFTTTVKWKDLSTKNLHFFYFLALSRPLLTMFLHFSDYQELHYQCTRSILQQLDEAHLLDSSKYLHHHLKLCSQFPFFDHLEQELLLFWPC